MDGGGRHRIGRRPTVWNMYLCYRHGKLENISKSKRFSLFFRATAKCCNESLFPHIQSWIFSRTEIYVETALQKTGLPNCEGC